MCAKFSVNYGVSKGHSASGTRDCKGGGSTDAVLEFGVSLILAIQQIHGPALDNIFRVITFLGEEQFFLILLPAIFWCVDFRFGAQIGVLLLLSSYLHISLKDLFHQPRPFDIDARVLQLSDADGYGLPSGHTQSATVIWGTIAAQVRRTWLWVAAIAIIVLVGFSRVYLGVHFPTDVLAAWLIGAGFVALYLKTAAGIERKLAKLSTGGQIAVALVVPVILLLLHPAKDNASAMGVLAGMGAGIALTRRYLHFSAGGPWRQRLLRLVIGLAIVAGLYFSLRVALPGGETALHLALRFLRYGLVGFIGAFAAPWLFRKMRLVTG